MLNLMFDQNCLMMLILRKEAKGVACPSRPVGDVKGKPGQMVIGGTLGFLNLKEQACVAMNPKRVLHVLGLWTKVPSELNRLTLRLHGCHTRLHTGGLLLWCLWCCQTTSSLWRNVEIFRWCWVVGWIFLLMSGLRSLVPPNHTQSSLLTPKGGSRLPRMQVVWGWTTCASLVDRFDGGHRPAFVPARSWIGVSFEQIWQLVGNLLLLFNCFWGSFVQSSCHHKALTIGNWMSDKFEEEEKQRNVIGLSARGKCLALVEIVDSFGARDGDAYKVIADKLAADWSIDTVKRYVTAARKLKSAPLTMEALTQLEFAQGRDSGLDGITALRSLISLNLEDVDAAFLAT